MAKFQEKERALQLRKQGMSYSQIKNKVEVSKSTLSLWLRQLPLSNERIQQLRDHNEVRIEKFRQTMAGKKQLRLNHYYTEALKEWSQLTSRELFLMGLGLYWGEGNKASKSEVSISNSDPSVIKFGLVWLRQCLLIPSEKIKIYLHLYEDMNPESEIDFWCKATGLPISNFAKPYIKKTTLASLTYQGFKHGTCNIVLHNTLIKERIMMTLKAIGSNHST